MIRRLQWYGHVRRSGEQRELNMTIHGESPRGRPRLRSMDTITRDTIASEWNGGEGCLVALMIWPAKVSIGKKHVKLFSESCMIIPLHR